MTYKNSLILFAVFMAAGFGSYVAARNGFYPVAIVNFDLVTARDAEKNYIAAYRYSRNALLVYGSDPAVLENPVSRLEIKRGTLEKLVLDELVYSELKRRSRKSDFYAAAQNKIDRYLSENKNVEEAAKNLYGFTLEEFRERVLLPQAYLEVLAGGMFLNNENFEEWFQQARNSAAVVILSPKLEWQEGGVRIKN